MRWCACLIWHPGLRLASWKWRFGAVPMVWCWLIFGFLFNNRGEGSFPHWKHLFFYSCPRISIILTLLGDKLLRDRLQSLSFIPQWWWMCEIWKIFLQLTMFLKKTHVFIWPNSPQTHQNLLLKLMTQERLQNYEKVNSEDDLYSPKQQHLCKNWTILLYISVMSLFWNFIKMTNSSVLSQCTL